jgi:hypothetical protein
MNKAEWKLESQTVIVTKTCVFFYFFAGTNEGEEEEEEINRLPWLGQGGRAAAGCACTAAALRC